MHFLKTWRDFWSGSGSGFAYGSHNFGKPITALVPHQSEKKPDLDSHKRQNWIQIRIKLKVTEQWRMKWSHGEPWTLTREAWRVCMPGVADLHHLDDKNDPVPD